VRGATFCNVWQHAADLPTHNKQVYVLDTSGRPLFWRYGNRSQAISKSPIMVNLVERAAMTKDPLE
jgi:hypothetical protein